MPKPSLTATTTVTQTVKLDTRVKQMLKARCEEYAKLAAQTKANEARQKRIRDEVEELFKKAGEDAALEEGTEIDGHKVKRVRGKQSTLDKLGLMNALGLTPDDLASFYEDKPKKPYIQIKAPGEKEEE